jgi:hypothetical protein
LVDKSPVAGVDQCPELRIESEAPVLLADQVHHCERGLVLMLSQTATDLLGQDCGGLSWPQKQHGVDGRNVNALAEDIDAEHAAELALLKAPEDRVTLSGIRLTRQGH